MSIQSGEVPATEQTATHALDHVNDAQALGFMESKALANFETPEIDSLAEWIGQLPAHGVPPEVCEAGAQHYLQVLTLHSKQCKSEDDAAGVFDHVRIQMRTAGLRSELDVPALARKLSPHLKTLRRADQKEPVDLLDLFDATCTVDRLYRQLGADAITTPNLVKYLGDKPYAFLKQLVKARTI